MSVNFRLPEGSSSSAAGPDDEEGTTRLLDRTNMVLSVPVAANPRPARYRIGRRIGSGGFAEVYEAQAEEGRAERVALKRLLPGLRQDPMRRRHLVREAQIAIQLNHPNIAQVRELVDLGDEMAIVMELVDGISANHLLHRLAQRSQRLTLGSVHHIMDGLLAALGYLANPPLLARRPLVHADISLENVMVTTEGQIKLIDFGIAGLDATVPDDDEEGLTSIHQVAGKRSYAPPEGQWAVPSVSTDLYAAGVCFWELIAGCRFPVLPQGVGSREMGSLIAFAAEGLPEGVWTTLQMCLSLDPAARPETAAQVRSLLRSACEAVSFEQGALGRLVCELLSRPPPPGLPHAPAASEPHDVIASLVERLHVAFCAHRVRAWEPVPPEEIESLGGHEFILRAERGEPGEPVPDSVLREALDCVFVQGEGGELLVRVRPPGMQAHVFMIQPDPGCVYEEKAQRLLRNLLCPDSPSL
ncbi:MAG: serine/threonine-protein kinase [Myxococcales bacterium]|nr:serine/threonine-protein kinase [Myxococcales bacterium]